MRKWLMALLGALALSVGIAWGESQNGKTNAASSESAACCCCGKSCPR